MSYVYKIIVVVFPDEVHASFLFTICHVQVEMNCNWANCGTEKIQRP